VLEKVAAVLVVELQGHRQSGGTQRRAIRGKGAVGAFLARIERHRRHSAGLMEVVVDVVGVIGTIPGAKARFAAQARFDHRHQRVEVADVALIERTGAFGEHELSAVAQAAGDHTRGVAPQDVVADVERRSGLGVSGRGHWLAITIGIGRRVIAAMLDAAFAVFVAVGLFGLVKPAFFDELLGVVLLDPGENGLGVAGNRVAKGGLLLRRECRFEQVNAGTEQEL